MKSFHSTLYRCIYTTIYLLHLLSSITLSHGWSIFKTLIYFHTRVAFSFWCSQELGFSVLFHMVISPFVKQLHISPQTSRINTTFESSAWKCQTTFREPLQEGCKGRGCDVAPYILLFYNTTKLCCWMALKISELSHPKAVLMRHYVSLCLLCQW